MLKQVLHTTLFNVFAFSIISLASAQAARAGTQPEPPAFYSGVCCHGPNNSACFPTNDVLDECYNLGLRYIIYGTCTPNSCPGNGIGACCFGFGSCIPEVDPTGCTNFGGTFQGVGSTCDGGPCDVAACCLAAGACQMMLRPACDAAGGGFLPYQICGQFDPCGVGACCASLTACTQQSAYDCIAVNHLGFAGSGSTCSPFNSCVFADGACCLFDGSCQQFNFSACSESAGHFYGVGTLCTNVDCSTAACCFSNGSCSLTDEVTCAGAGGVWSSQGNCSDSPCGLSACCVLANCVQATLAGCYEINGEPWGTPGQACDPGLCGVPLCPCQGDANEDNQRDGRDIKSFVDCAIQAGPGGSVPSGCDCADVVEDGSLDSNDVQGMVLVLLGGGC